MSGRIRKQVYLDPQQEARLKQLAAETGLTEAELIRQALDRGLPPLAAGRRNRQAWQEELQFIEGWLQRAPVLPDRQWTREDLYVRKICGR